MKIHAHILAYNEEMLLPFTLDYYSVFCEKIFIYDNMSTDSSDEIYKKYEKVEVIKWDSNNEINELNYVRIKSEEYKKRSRNQNVDWVIVCDCDELLYHPSLLKKLEDYKKNKITIPKISGHNMISEEFPKYDGKLITEKINYGTERIQMMCKNIIFNPDINLEYEIGAHSCIADNGVYSRYEEIKLLHYKFLSKKYVKEIFENRKKRLSKYNLKNGYGIHYIEYSDELFEEKLKNKVKLI